MTKHDTKLGFSMVEALLVLVAVGILGFTGWYVYHAKQASDKNYSTSASTTVPTFKKKTSTKAIAPVTDPYAGWKTYAATKEGLSFKYPSSWTAQDDPCVGQCYQFLTPQTSNSPYIFEITYYWNQQAPPTSIKDGEAIKTLTPLQVPKTKTPLSLVGYSENQLDTTNIFALTLSDQSYSVGQTVGKIPNIQSQTQSGITYTLTAVMKTPSQQDNEGYTLAQYQAQPDYKNVVKMFQSLAY